MSFQIAAKGQRYQGMFCFVLVVILISKLIVYTIGDSHFIIYAHPTLK
jgi:hypothetical protein